MHEQSNTNFSIAFFCVYQIVLEFYFFLIFSLMRISLLMSQLYHEAHLSLTVVRFKNTNNCIISGIPLTVANYLRASEGHFDK